MELLSNSALIDDVEGEYAINWPILSDLSRLPLDSHHDAFYAEYQPFPVKYLRLSW